MTNGIIKSPASCAAVAALVALALFAAPARAAQSTAPAAPTATTPAAAVFATGSRVGLVPPPGMTLSKTFPGFIDPDQHGVILIGTLPAAASADIEKMLSPETLTKQGITLQKREPLQLNFTKGILIEGTQSAPDKTLYRKWMLVAPTGEFTALVTVQVPERSTAYPDAVVRAALSTVTVRSAVPQAELLSLLPFTVGDLAGFRVINVIPGRALLLIDAPEYPHMVVTQGLPAYELDARVIIAAAPGGPGFEWSSPDFTRAAFDTIGGIKDVEFTMSEAVRIDDQEGIRDRRPRQGRGHRRESHGRAVAAFRQRRISANGRHFAGRNLGPRVGAPSHASR